MPWLPYDKLLTTSARYQVVFVGTFLRLVSTAVISGQHSPRMVKGMTDTQNISFHLQFMFNFRINFRGK